MKKYRVSRTNEGKIITERYVASRSEYNKCIYIDSKKTSTNIKKVIGEIFIEYDEYISATDNSKPAFYDIRISIIGDDNSCGNPIYSIGEKQHLRNLTAILYAFNVMADGKLIEGSNNLDKKICIMYYDDNMDTVDVTVLNLLELYKIMTKKRKMNITINSSGNLRVVKADFSLLNGVNISKYVPEKFSKDVDSIGISPYILTF